METVDKLITYTLNLYVDLDNDPDNPVIVPIHIIRLERHTGAIIGIERGPGKILANGGALRNPKDSDDPAYGEKLAVKRACEMLDGSPRWNYSDVYGYAMGPMGEKIYREYRVYARNCELMLTKPECNE